MDGHLLLEHWRRLRDGTLKTLDLFQEDELGYAPVEGGYAIREIVLHIAHEEAIEILYGLARLEPDMPVPFPAGDFPTRDSLRRLLASVHARSLAHLEGLSPSSWQENVVLAWEESLRPVDVLLHVIEHETHHRGELSLAVGLLGRPGLDA